jgi:hypothetical protein
VTNICLVSCVKSKAKKENKARNLYTSALFEKARKVAESEFDKWYILSAKYGLVSPNKVIQPYEQTLNQMGQKERIAWAKDVCIKLKKIVGPSDKITFFAGLNYRENLIEELEKLGCEVEFPMEGMSIGNQLKWLSFSEHRRKILQDIEKFYELINSLEIGLSGKKNIGELSGKSGLPKKGVYFFFEPKEKRRFKPDKLRVIRVGTHGVSRGSKSSLWQRIKTHIGTNSGGGNHRGSIFRLHIGNSILEKKILSSKYPSWGIGQTGTREQKEEEKLIESLVSEYISNMSILWVEIDDEAGPNSDRAYIERNAIGLLSFAVPTIDRPSKEWNGHYSVKETIRASGLWNINHVNGGYDPEFLKIFETYVKATKGEIEKPKSTLSLTCPSENIIKSDTNQMQLFLE